MDTLPLILAASALVLAVVVYLVIRLVKKSTARKNEELDKISKYLNGELETGSWKEQPKIEGDFRGRDFLLTFHVVNTGQSSITYLDLKMPAAAPGFELTVKKKNIFNKMTQKLGLSGAITSGDPGFDSRVFVKGEPEQKLTAMIYDINFRHAARKLADRAYTVKLEENGERLAATKVYSRKKDLKGEVLESDLTALSDLGQALEGEGKGW